MDICIWADGNGQDLYHAGHRQSTWRYTQVNFDQLILEPLKPSFRTLQYLLNRLREEDLANDGASSVLGMSYLEVYNEKIVDLLDGSNQDIKIQTTKNGELNLLGLKKYGVEKFDEFKRIFITANEKRSVSSTRLNNESSRSHR